MTKGGLHGFTLIELSIVLVIIGLIVGGVLVGQSLISAAGVRAQITQIEKFNAATNTFYSKYGYLPGDIKDPDASSFGFAARGQYAGEGDGNGVLEGTSNNDAPDNRGDNQGCGETAAFWNDLATAHLIEGSYIGLTNCVMTSAVTAISSYLPQAKIGQNYVYVWSTPNGSGVGNTGNNYFGIAAVSTLGPYGQMSSTPGLRVQQAYAVDAKVDDGYPMSGRILSIYADGPGGWLTWASNGTVSYIPFTTATAGSSSTCFDNGNTAGVKQT